MRTNARPFTASTTGKRESAKPHGDNPRRRSRVEIY